MKKIRLVAITLLALVLSFSSCTDNQRARKYGGTEYVKLEPQEKFINISWKQDDLWVVVQDTITKVYYVREKSSYGIMEGKIIITK